MAVAGVPLVLGCAAGAEHHVSPVRAGSGFPGRRSGLAIPQAAVAAAKEQKFRKLLNKEIAHVLLDLRNEQLLS